MNAHDVSNSVAFGLSGLLLAQNHLTNVFSKLYDVWAYTWNDRNETTGFSEKSASATYKYDSLDRRIGVDETSGGTTTQTWIVYNGNSNTPYAMFNGSGTLLERYLAGPSYVPGVTGMIARTNASGVTDWYLTGKLGSVRDIVNTSGTVIDHISYGAFGSIRAETNPSSGSQFKFDGMQYDTITGLYNDWHRGYSSTIGIFLSLDPTEYQAGDSNLYRFVFNDVMNLLDINGFQAGGGGGGGGGGNADQFFIWMAREGQFLAALDQRELLGEARNDARLISEYGTEVCDLAKQMIIDMTQSILKKYHIYIHLGNRVGVLHLRIDITIHFPGLNGGRPPEFGSGNPGEEWGQAWVGQPVAPNHTPQIHFGPGGSIFIVNPAPPPGLGTPGILFPD